MELLSKQEERGYRQPRKLGILILLSSLGGITSFFVGYAGDFLSFIPVGRFIAGQLLAGLHVFWLILVAIIVKHRGAATVAGGLKGLIEMFMPNHLGPFVFLMSLFEGFVIDVVRAPFRRVSPTLVYLASGFSAASNVLVLQLFVFPNLPLIAEISTSVYAGMYTTSFFSGILFGGYLSLKTLSSLRQLLPSQSFPQKTNKNRV